MTAHDALTRSFSAKLTVDDYLLLDRSGAFDGYAKTELIDGRVFAVNATFSEHYIVQTRLLRRLADACDALGRGIEAWAEGSIGMPPDSVPQPDIFVTGKTPESGLTRLENVLLVAEVASTTLKQDLGRKQKLYARAAIAEYWVLDVTARVIHRMWHPDGNAYREADHTAFDQPISAVTIPGLAVATTGF